MQKFAEIPDLLECMRVEGFLHSNKQLNFYSNVIVVDSRQELDRKMWRLSKCINKETELYDLALEGLNNISQDDIDQALQNNRHSISFAVNKVLKVFADGIQSPQDTYNKLCQALRKVKMANHINTMDKVD